MTEAWMRKQSVFLFYKKGWCKTYRPSKNAEYEQDLTEDRSEVPDQSSYRLIYECIGRCFRIVASSSSVEIRNTKCDTPLRIVCAGKTKM